MEMDNWDMRDEARGLKTGRKHVLSAVNSLSRIATSILSKAERRPGNHPSLLPSPTTSYIPHNRYEHHCPNPLLRLPPVDTGPQPRKSPP